jgi:hypothetical protein
MDEAESNATNNESNKTHRTVAATLLYRGEEGGGWRKSPRRPRYAIPICLNLSRKAETTVLLWVITEDRNPEHLSSRTYCYLLMMGNNMPETCRGD